MPSESSAKRGAGEPRGLPRPRGQQEASRRLWPKEAVAELLGVKRSFVDALIRRGELAVVALGYRTHRVTDASLEDFLRRISK